MMAPMTRRIYMDYAATTPVDPLVVEAMKPYFFDVFGNPASPHGFGFAASSALESSRETVARHLGAKSDEIIFTSGATESVNHVVAAVAARTASPGRMILSAVEHPCALESAEALRSHGWEIDLCPVDADGLVDPEAISALISSQTRLIAVMQANNEVGTIQPVREIGRVARDRGIPFLVDASQSFGQMSCNVGEIQADYCVISAHKCYGPKGVGALYIRSGQDLPSFLKGGSQEKGRRASTVNVAGAVGLAKAMDICCEHMSSEMDVLKGLRNELLERLLSAVDGVRLNGHRQKRLPKNLHVSLESVKGEQLVMLLDMANIAASQGSACAAGTMKGSHVLKAMGLSDGQMAGALRLSIGRWTTMADIEETVHHIQRIVQRLRR